MICVTMLWSKILFFRWIRIVLGNRCDDWIISGGGHLIHSLERTDQRHPDGALIDGEVIINPDEKQREISQMLVTLAGTEEKICMIEAGANEAR